MGYDLTNKHDEDFRLNIHGYGAAFRLAVQFGWNPEPTISYERVPINEETDDEEWVDTDEIDMEWEGGYFSNDSQWVTESSAKGWADALTRALPYIPDEETRPGSVVWSGLDMNDQLREGLKNSFLRDYPERKRESVIVMTLKEYEVADTIPDVLYLQHEEGYEVPAIDEFSGQRMKEYLRKFIAYLQRGTFQVY